MIDIKKDIADIKRFKEILGIIFEEGFAFILENTSLHRFVPVKKKLKIKREIKISNEVRLRKTLERLGPTFIKFGQLLSIRPDFVPKEYIHELEKLQDNVPAFSYEEVKETIEKSIGNKITEIFEKFEKKPVASASIAQVHEAVLKTGERIAVKVRRPGIRGIVEKDVEIMMFIAKLLEKHVKGLRKYRPTIIVSEFAEWTKKEIDFNIETENIKRFYENFKGSKTTVIPKVYGQYCNESVIVMEFIDGTELHKIGKNKKKILGKAVKNGFYSILEQVFIHGLFHADPHPSNIIILKNSKVGFVDFGIVGNFDNNLKNKAIDLFIGISEGDTDKVIEALLELGEIDEDKDINKFKEKINDAVYLIRGSDIKKIKISRILEDVLDISLEFGVRMPREFVLFAKTIVTIEGIALTYYPEFRFGESVQPFLEKIIIERYNPKKIIKEGFTNFLGWKKMFDKLPGQTVRVLDKLEKGKIKIEMRDTDIEKLSIELDKSSNRLTYGMLIAALLVSGSLAINIGDRMIMGLPVISLLCFLSAGILGIVLFVSILKEK